MVPWLPTPDAPPQWVADYAKAFCAGDATTVAARIDETLEVSQGEVGLQYWWVFTVKADEIVRID